MTATLGKSQELRALLVDWSNAEQERGARVSLLSKVEGPGGTFVLNRFFKNLTGLEEWRAECSTNADRRAWFEKRDAMLAQPGEVTITESLVTPCGVSVNCRGGPFGALSRRALEWARYPERVRPPSAPLAYVQ